MTEEEKCIPCSGSAIALDNDAIAQKLSKLNEWEVIDGNKKIHKKFTFKNFKQALEFVNLIAEVAEQNKHHPDINFGWGYCKVTLQTHAIDGLHENDFIIAKKIDSIGK
jgi:4a-hydroxytetrahydrobiopterin dehydratase